MNILNRYKGFEELDLENPVTTEGEVTEIAEAVVKGEIAEIQAELEQVGAEIDEIQSDVAEQDEAVEELAETVDGLESLLSSGQFNSTAFASMYNRASRLNAILGGRSMDRLGAESLSDAATATVMARQGCEGFMETVKGWANSAIEAIKHIFDAIINFFVGLFSSADKLARRASQLETRLKSADKVKEKVKLGNWNLFFNYEKNGVNRDLEGWASTQAALKNFSAVGYEVSKVSLSSFNGAYAALEAAIKKDAKKDVDAAEKGEGDKRVLIGMSGGIRIHAELKDGTAKDLKEAAVYARSIKINFSTTGDKKLTSGEVAAKADKSALGALISKVKASVTSLRSDKVAGTFNKAKRDQVIGSLKVLKADDKEKSEEVNAQIALVRAIFSTGSAVAKSTTSQQVKAASWSLDLVAAHI